MKLHDLFINNGWNKTVIHSWEAYCIIMPDHTYFLATNQVDNLLPTNHEKILVGHYHIDDEPVATPYIISWEQLYDVIEDYIERYNSLLTEEEHSKYSPSQLPRIIPCPGSAQLHVPQPSSSYAREGTLAHDITASLLQNNITEVSPIHLSVFPEEDQQEMGYAIQDCVDYANDLLEQYKDDDPYVMIETRVRLAGFIEDLNCPELIDTHGTGDLIIMIPNKGLIHVIDWKFGKGIEVYPDSEQLYAYGLGALKNPRVMKNFDDVILHIGQPRLYSGDKFKTFETTPEFLYNWAANDLCPALKLTQVQPPILKPTEKGCQWCSIKAVCTARHEWADNVAQDVFAAYAELPYVKKPEELYAILEKGREYVAYIKAIEKFLVNTLRAGVEVPGIKMVEGRSIRTWHSPKEFVLWANEYVPEAEIFEEPKLVSPSKAESIVKRKLAKTEEFQALIHKPPGKPTLVTSDDPREAINFADASDVFADFVEED